MDRTVVAAVSLAENSHLCADNKRVGKTILLVAINFQFTYLTDVSILPQQWHSKATSDFPHVAFAHPNDPKETNPNFDSCDYLAWRVA